MSTTQIIVLAVSLIGFAIFALVYCWAKARRKRKNQEIVFSMDYYKKIDMPAPDWKPNIPVDINRIADRFRHYSNNKHAFAVCKHGTCVKISRDSENPNKEVLEVLFKIYTYHPDFNVLPMDDGSWCLTYSQPAFSVVFKEEYLNNREYIEENLKGALTPHEALIGSENQTESEKERIKVGLFGRARLFMDILSPEIMKVCNPQSGP